MKNNDNITKDVEGVSYWKDLEREVKWLKDELHRLVNERNALVKINQPLAALVRELTETKGDES